MINLRVGQLRNNSANRYVVRVIIINKKNQLKRMANLNIKMEYDLTALSQHLRTMEDAWLEKLDSDSLEQVRQELMEELSTAYQKSQQSSKGKRRRKKNKKEAEDERAASQELTRILDSMLTHNQKYHNVKKNLTRLADKIDSSELLYSILNPLVIKQIQAYENESQPGNHTPIQNLEAIAMLYGRMQQGMSQIEQVFTFFMEANVESFECSNFAEKVVVYLLLRYPQQIPIFVDWERHVPKQHTQIVATMLVLSTVLPFFEELSSRKCHSSDKNCATTEDRSDQYLQDEPEHEQQSIDNDRDDRQLQFLQNVTSKEVRLEVDLDDVWLRQICDVLRRQTRLV